MQQRRLLAVVIGPLAAGVLMAGCGGSDNSSSSSAQAKANNAAGNSSTLSLSADPSGALKFNKKVLSTKSGAVTINMSNPSSVPHGIAVEGNGVDKDGQTVTSGGT